MNQVGWADYAGTDFGSSSQSEVEELNKALTAGSDRDPPASVVAGDGFALRQESLEATLKNTTFKMKHVVFWRDITKGAAFNTIEEYNQIHSYGNSQDSAFIAEGDLPSESDAEYERKHSVVKFMGVTKKVSHVASLIKSAHGQAVARETVNGTMDLLRNIERALFKGRSDLSALQFDGIEKMLEDGAPAANIIDLRGQPLTEDILTDAALTVSDAPNYGSATDLYLNPKTHADVGKSFFPKERTVPGLTNGVAGLELKGWTSPAGYVNFKPNTFIDDGGPAGAARGDATKRPANPLVSTAPTTPASTNPLFGDDDAGDYFYKVQAVNRYGRSAFVELVAGPTAVTVVSGDKVTFGMSPGSGIAVEWYEVFRTKVNGATGSERLILRVANAGGAGEQILEDLNASLPYCTTGYLLEMTPENIGIKQLAPMVRIPLATIDSSIRWMQLVYLVLQVFTPSHNVLIKNIGRPTNFVGQP